MTSEQLNDVARSVLTEPLADLCDNEGTIKRYLSNIVHLALTQEKHDMFEELYADWVKIDRNMFNMFWENFERHCALPNVVSDNTLLSTQMGEFVRLHEERQMLLIRHLFLYCQRLTTLDLGVYMRNSNKDNNIRNNLHYFLVILRRLCGMSDYKMSKISNYVYPEWKNVNDWKFMIPGDESSVSSVSSDESSDDSDDDDYDESSDDYDDSDDDDYDDEFSESSDSSDDDKKKRKRKIVLKTNKKTKN